MNGISLAKVGARYLVKARRELAYNRLSERFGFYHTIYTKCNVRLNGRHRGYWVNEMSNMFICPKIKKRKARRRKGK